MEKLGTIRNRQVDIDLLKSLLMYFVVLGHFIKVAEVGRLDDIYRIIFWFHMPAFFLITGYLTNFRKDSTKTFIENKFFGYVIPYFSFCIAAILLYRLNYLEYFMRTLWGGGMHYGITGPFWYINCLFVSLIFIKIFIDRKRIKELFVVVIVMWFVAHYYREFLFLPIPDWATKYIKTMDMIPFPWGTNEMFLALLYILIGNLATNYSKLKNLCPYFVFAAILFYVYDSNIEGYFVFNMKNILCNHVLLDLLVPIFFTLSLWWICSFVTEILPDSISKYIIIIGKSGLVCYFIHMFFIDSIVGIITVDKYSVFLYSLAIQLFSVLLFLLFEKAKVTRWLFLGKR